MILPIVAYGHPTLRKRAADISPDYPELAKLIDDMYETMYASKGVGLAAPQVNKSIRMIVIDTSPFDDDYPDAKDFKEVLINPEIISEDGEEWLFNEGCLSVPEIREDISRKKNIHVSYLDRNFKPHDEYFSGIIARVIQHEYDHLEGTLFVDRVSSLRKMLLKRKLMDISKGNIHVNYKMIFPNQKKH